MLKILMYILSLWFLFFFVIILTTNIPICFTDCSFIGFNSLFEVFKNNLLPIACVFFIIIGCFSYKYFSYYIKGNREIPFTIDSIETINFEHLTFLATYIIPLISIDFEKSRSAIIFFLLIFLMGAIYIKTDLFYANPSLALLGFKIYKADGNFKNADNRQNIILISKNNLSLGDKVSYRKLDDRIYFVEKVS